MKITAQQPPHYAGPLLIIIHSHSRRQQTADAFSLGLELFLIMGRAATHISHRLNCQRSVAKNTFRSLHHRRVENAMRTFAARWSH